MAEVYNSSHTGAAIDAAVSAVKSKENTWDGKQNKLTGKAGQFVGFDAQGNAVAEDANFLPAENGENGSLLLNDVYFNGNNVKEVNELEVAKLKIMTPGGGTPDAQIIAGAGYADFSAIDLRVSDTPKNDFSAANKGYVDAQRPKQQLVTLTASGWENHLPGDAEVVPDGQTYRYQAVSVPGILADESKQLIQPMPAMDAQELYIYHGVRCMQQSENQLIFYCDTVPVDDLIVYIVWQEVQAG